MCHRCATLIFLSAPSFGLPCTSAHPGLCHSGSRLPTLSHLYGRTSPCGTLTSTSQHDQRILAKLTHEVQYDALTHARNWATFRSDLNDTFDNHDDHLLALITIDVDHFKQINDTYGHLMGNQTLIAFSRQLKQLLSNQNDSYKFYRTGGEEFAILLPNTSLDTARKVVHDCQLALKTLAIPLTEGQLQVTA